MPLAVLRPEAVRLAAPNPGEYARSRRPLAAPRLRCKDENRRRRRPWARMEQALRAADCWAGGFSVIVLDMAGIAPGVGKMPDAGQVLPRVRITEQRVSLRDRHCRNQGIVWPPGNAGEESTRACSRIGHYGLRCRERKLSCGHCACQGAFAAISESCPHRRREYGVGGVAALSARSQRRAVRNVFLCGDSHPRYAVRYQKKNSSPASGNQASAYVRWRAAECRICFNVEPVFTLERKIRPLKSSTR